ncbi:Transposon Tf2-9 polyprotein [Labeo rohita]|uniref:ribonuclease H n=1 Tax=Labeo rohita TaxID=84645 RepID=A0ABQ8LUT5_LABRO|nr:Transposon Tf2-9 polyprotein [Labeo rohita]
MHRAIGQSILSSPVILKLHMDPNNPESTLQKTSPHSDPAAVAQLSSELSAHATQLAAHHHQLTRLTTLTEELVKTLQSLQIMPSAPAPMAATAPAPPAISSAASSPATISPRLAFPEKFDRDPAKWRRTAADYALTFRTLATQTTWVEDTLKVLFRRGLCEELQSELACRDKGCSLNEYIQLAIQVDNLIRSRRPSCTSTHLLPETAPATESMQVGTTHLTLEERERRMLNHLCLYCGQAGHIKSSCPVRPANPSRAVSVYSLLTVSNSMEALDGRPLGEGRVQSITEGEHCLPTIRPLRTSTPPLSELTPNAVDLPSEYEDLKIAFSKEKASAMDCAIELLPGQSPPKERIFPLSQPESEAMSNYIKEELAKGFIRPSTSPASAGFFFVKKKDGGLRPCFDYHGLNEVTVKFRYPLPLVPAALEKLCQARYYTKLDLRNAYNLIRIREGDEWKTAFSTTSGHYEYLVMPFGLANCLSIFQSFMNDVFRDMLDKWVIVYIDDILIYSNALSGHIQHVRTVLKRLIQYQLYVKLEKCELQQTSTSFLGYIISQDGVAMDENKVEAVLKWPQPRTLKELQSFLGFANFYRRFIRNFSSVAAPLTAMTKRQTTRLTWSPDALRAFDELRERFTSVPILRHPDPNEPFIVEVDASNTGVGAILSQRHGDPAKMYPCAYFSQKLSPAERNYDVGNRELLAMKLALEEWRHWLEGAKHPFTILTDHKNLEYLRSAKRFSSPWDRCHNPTTTKSILVAHISNRNHTISIDFITDLPNSQGNTVIFTIIDRFSKACRLIPLPKLPSAFEAAELLCNHVFRLYGLPEDIVLDRGPQFTSRVWSSFFKLLNVNVSLTSGYHPQSNGQTERLNQEIIRFLRSYCYNNQSDWSRYLIFTIIDRFSKACRLIPLPKLPSAFEAAELLCNHVFRLYGLPEDIVLDRGPQFTSRVWSSFFKLLNVNVSLTSGYHPQSNGQTERLNQEIIRFLRSYCYNNQSDWSRYLMWAEYAQNSLVKPVTGITPFQCILGYQPPMFPWSGEPSDLPSVTDWLHRSEETWDQAHTHLSRAIRKQTRTANQHHRPGPRYTPGQWVWLSTRDLRLKLPCKKLSPRYVGPFQIIKEITPVSFRLDLPANYRISPTFHMSLLKPAGGPRGELE